MLLQKIIFTVPAGIFSFFKNSKRLCKYLDKLFFSYRFQDLVQSTGNKNPFYLFEIIISAHSNRNDSRILCLQSL